MSGFKWGDVHNMKISGPKATQLYNFCLALIEVLEQRREWANLVVKLFPELPDILHPEISTWHCFEKFKRAFILKYDSSDDTWELNFADDPQGPPPGSLGSPSEARAPAKKAQRPNAARPARARRPRKATLKRILFKSYIRLETHFLDQILPSMRERVRAMREFGQAALETMTQGLVRFRATLAWKISSLFRGFDEPLAQASYGNAHMERRLVGVGTGLVLILSTFVPERPVVQWEAWLFGKILEEEFILT
jgi:hypothetical protein